MHFLTLAALEISQIQEDKELDNQIAEALKELELQKQIETKNFMLDFAIGRCQNLQSSFSRAVNDGVSELMYPYCESLEDPEYLEFEDRTEKLREEYEDAVDCIKLPQGTIVEQYGDPLWGRFVVRDGKVFQRDAGPLHHEKRTNEWWLCLIIPAKSSIRVLRNMQKKGVAFLLMKSIKAMDIIIIQTPYGIGIPLAGDGRRCFW